MLRHLNGLSEHSLGVHVSGKLHDDDFDRFMPMIDAAAERGGRCRILAEFEDFGGWDRYGLWEDPNISAGHADCVERIALVGDAGARDWMRKFAAPFENAEVRFFAPAEVDQARTWLDS